MDIFKLKENNTNIKTEIIAGLTTFFTMSYLFVLSPKLLEASGMNIASSITVTGLMVFIGSLLMAFIANKPYAVAPFLGETAFIAYTLVMTMGYSVKSALSAIFICGIILLIMSITNLRTYIIKQIPENIKLSFCVGLGLFFIFIALRDIGIIKFSSKAIPLQLGDIISLPVILGIFCLLLIVILVKRNIKGAVIIAILLTTFFGIVFKDINLPSQIISIPSSITTSFMQFNITSIINKNFIPVLFVLFILINIDTSGALIALSYTSGNDDKDKKSMIADSLSVILAPILGTTTPGAYIDSMTGISAGGKTGLTAIVVGILFLLGLLFTPFILIIPPYAYAPALLYVGILMCSMINKLDFKDISEFAPAFLTIAVMIFSYNIGAGIVSAFIFYPLIQLFTGNKNKTNTISWIMFVLSVIFFIIYPY